MTALLRRAPLALALLALIATGACSDPSAPAGNVLVRLQNASAFSFDEVEVGFPSQTESYGPLAAGAESGYRAVSSAYRYAYVRVRSGSKTVVQQPIDYLGEMQLTPGRYTYVIDLTSLDEPFAAITHLKPE